MERKKEFGDNDESREEEGKIGEEEKEGWVKYSPNLSCNINSHSLLKALLVPINI